VVHVIIVEGPDGAGKTQLVETLAREFPISLNVGTRAVDRADLWKVGASSVWDAIVSDVIPHSTCQLWDRLYFSELIYPKYMDRQSAFQTPHMMGYCSRVLEGLETLVLLCLPPLEVVMDNCANTKQHAWVADNARDIYLDYARFPWREGTIVYDYTKDDVEYQGIHREVAAHIRRRRERYGPA
jgi:hypothetical protein